MTRDEAKQRIKDVPKYVPAPCPDCGAVTIEEAEKKCRPQQLPCGEYVCATPDNAPDTDGLIHQLNPEYVELDGYLWEWFAFDEGQTKTPPVWREKEM